MKNVELDIAKVGLTPDQADHIISTAKAASESLWKLEALTKALMNETKDNEHDTVHQLAKLGNFHVMDQANVTDCMIESLELGEVL